MPTQQDIYAHMERRMRRLDCRTIGETTVRLIILDAASRWPSVAHSDLESVSRDVCRAVKDKRAEESRTNDDWMSDDERASLDDDAGLDSAGGEL